MTLFALVWLYIFGAGATYAAIQGFVDKRSARLIIFAFWPVLVPMRVISYARKTAGASYDHHSPR